MFFALLTMLLINAASSKHYLVKTKKGSHSGNDMKMKKHAGWSQDYEGYKKVDDGGEADKSTDGGYHSEMDTDAIMVKLAQGEIPTDEELIELKNIVAHVFENLDLSKYDGGIKLMTNLYKAVPWAKINKLIPYEEIKKLLPVPLDDVSLRGLQHIYQFKVPSDEEFIALKNYIIKVAESADDAPKEDAPKEDAPKEDAPKEDAPKYERRM